MDDDTELRLLQDQIDRARRHAAEHPGRRRMPVSELLEKIDRASERPGPRLSPALRDAQDRWNRQQELDMEEIRARGLDPRFWHLDGSGNLRYGRHSQRPWPDASPRA